MSKPLVTKVKMSKLGPKCQYFVWPPLFSSTALTLLGTGVLFHPSITTSRSWWMLETLQSSTFRLRMPHRCSIGFKSGDMLGQSITLPSASLARQWTLSCWNTALRPSLRREGLILVSSDHMTWFCHYCHVLSLLVFSKLFEGFLVHHL